MSDTLLTQTTAASPPSTAPTPSGPALAPGDTPANAMGLWNKVAAKGVAENEAKQVQLAAKPAAPPLQGQPAAPQPQPAAMPESYAEFSLPEGTTKDPELAGEFGALAKELGLPQEGAQRLVDLYVGRARDAAEAPYRQWQEQQGQWQKQVKADRELGGLALGRNIATAAKAIDAFGGPELRRALEATGAGNHPEMVRFFYRVGKAISEDGMVTSRAARSSKSYAEVFYPDHNN